MPKKRGKKTVLPTWDFTGLYSGIDDPKLAKDTISLLKEAEAFEYRYRGKIAGIVKKPVEVRKAIQAYEKLREQAGLIEAYVQALFSCNTTDHEYGAFLQQARKTTITVQHATFFLELELLALPAQALQRLSAAPALQNYHHFLAKLQAMQPHRLSEVEEKILADKSLTSSAAFSRLFEQEVTQIRFVAPDRKRKKVYTQSEILRLLSHPDRVQRRVAAKALTQGLQAHAQRLGYIYSMLVEDKSIEDRYRHFPTPEASRHLENETDEASVAAMVTATVKQYPLAQSYYRLKKKVLGYDQLYDYDRYAPIRKKHRHYSYAQAQSIIKRAFNRFHPVHAQIAEEFFEKGWIDAAPRPGKQAGAYCTYLTPATHPLVFVNYHHDSESVNVLAHELGHGVHAALAREQSWLNFDWPLTLAETASTFAELLVFDALKEQLKNSPQELLELYMSKLDGIAAAVFRQISMFRFEQKLHVTHREQGEVSVPRINALWRASQQELYGSAVTLTPGYDWWWSYIPHFIRTPFYVYAYAFGQLFASAIYLRHLKGESNMAERYLNMLRQGGSKTPQELAATLDIDLHDPNFWQEGFGLFQQLLRDATRLAARS